MIQHVDDDLFGSCWHSFGWLSNILKAKICFRNPVFKVQGAFRFYGITKLSCFLSEGFYFGFVIERLISDKEFMSSLNKEIHLLALNAPFFF